MQSNDLDMPIDLVTGSMVEDGMISLCLDGSDVELRGKADDAKAQAAANKEAIERSLRGEHIEMNATIRAYGQGGSFRNRKFTRFTSKALAQYARSASNTLFQRNHSLSTEDTGGLILGGKVEVNGDERVLVEQVRLVHPWAVRDALLGTMRTFSIHWRPLSMDSVMCTACKAPAYGQGCMHYPGQQVETKAGAVDVVEFEYSDVESVETSAVVFPAVVGTGIQRIAEQLSAIREQLRATSYPTRRPSMKVIATALGMSVDSDENALAVRAGKLSADVDELAKANMAKDTEIVKLRTELAAAETAKAQAEKASRDIECDALIEKLSKEGRVTPGGEREKFLRMLYAKGQHELAQQVAASYGEGAPIVPVGDKQQAYRGTGSSAKRLDGVPQTSDGKVDFAKLVEALPPEVRAGVANLNPEDVVRGNRQRIEGILNISLEGV